MTLGIISDIHSNTVALEAVLTELHEIHSVDHIVCAGDVVGLLGDPNETIELVRDHVTCTIYGNHDYRVFPDSEFIPNRATEIAEYELVMEETTDENYEWLTGLPGMKTFQDSVTVAHSRPNPDDPTGMKTGDGGIPPRKFTQIDADGGIVVLGHTHTQHALNLDKFDGKEGLAVNPGAVGHPYSDGLAGYAVVDEETQEYGLYRAEYNSDVVSDHLDELEIDPFREYDTSGKGSMRRP